MRVAGTRGQHTRQSPHLLDGPERQCATNELAASAVIREIEVRVRDLSRRGLTSHAGVSFVEPFLLHRAAGLGLGRRWRLAG
jgi:hypothetical protein